MSLPFKELKSQELMLRLSLLEGKDGVKWKPFNTTMM